VGVDPADVWGRPMALRITAGPRANTEAEAICPQRSHRGSDDGMHERGNQEQHGKPRPMLASSGNGCLARDRTRLDGVADGVVVPRMPGNAGGGKDPWFKANVRSGESQEIGPLGLLTPNTVGKLQAALHAKAKKASDYRFYTLYDKVCRKDVLHQAYRKCKANGGAPGVDGVTFEVIESVGLEVWLDVLTDELINKRYAPSAVRRVRIPKGNGKARPLGIPTIRDRVVQTAAVMILEPIFEADLQDEQYGYRPGRSAHDAIRQIRRWLDCGYMDVVDADLSGYFDSIPHGELLKSVARRMSDGAMLHLLKMWLEMPVEEAASNGAHYRTTENRDRRRGTPQGAPISPLLSNIYMRRFILGWKTLGYQRRLNARIVNYADDFVICCKDTARQASEAMRCMMAKLQLVVNERKTRLCQVKDVSLDFLGYTMGVLRGRLNGKPYVGLHASRESTGVMLRAITEMTGPHHGWFVLPEMVKRLNRMLRGWANYFNLGGSSRTHAKIDQHVRSRLRRWLCRKHKVKGDGYWRWPVTYLDTIGLVRVDPARQCPS